MKTKNISFSYREYDGSGQLPGEDGDLVSSAREAALNAYAPYSGFNVGAAVRLESGTIVKGANMENAAFPSGICAERSALSNCISNYPGDRPVAIAIAALTDKGLTDDPVSPCGNCRQVLAEEELKSGSNIKVILSGRNLIQVVESCSHLLPLQFSKEDL
jgi:cytidine deaminase